MQKIDAIGNHITNFAETLGMMEVYECCILFDRRRFTAVL